MMMKELVVVFALSGFLYLVPTTEGATPEQIDSFNSSLNLYCDEVALQPIGCYNDDLSSILPASKTSVPDNIPRSCVEQCLNTGFPFAGIQSGDQCFCGTNAPPRYNKTAETKCDLTCPKSPSIRCGGKLKTNAYKTKLPDEVALKPFGCYDDKNSTVLNGEKKTLKENTPANCIDGCLTSGYKYAGVESGNQCVCGDKAPLDPLLSADKCDLPCPKSSSIKCGGKQTITVYTTGLPEVYPVALGCFLDDPLNRTLPNVLTDRTYFTPKRCVYQCLFAGYQYAGVENGDQCFCGDKAPSSEKLDATSRCNTTCKSTKTELCGGPRALDIYNTGLEIVITENLGCFEDDTKKRLFPKKLSDIPDNTPINCKDQCFSAGFKFAGTESGNQCFCGKTLPPKSAVLPQDRCFKGCPKSPSFRCGGARALAVFNAEPADKNQDKSVFCLEINKNQFCFNDTKLNATLKKCEAKLPKQKGVSTTDQLCKISTVNTNKTTDILACFYDGIANVPPPPKVTTTEATVTTTTAASVTTTPASVTTTPTIKPKCKNVTTTAVPTT